MTKIDTGWTPVDQLVGAVCMQCETPLPEILHCHYRCKNKDGYVVCDCDCCFPNQGMAEQMSYEVMYNL